MYIRIHTCVHTRARTHTHTGEAANTAEGMSDQEAWTVIRDNLVKMFASVPDNYKVCVCVWLCVWVWWVGGWVGG